MDLKTYIKDISKRCELAIAVGTSPEYLRLIANGHRQIGASMAQLIDAHTKGKVNKRTLRPDLWS